MWWWCHAHKEELMIPKEIFCLICSSLPSITSWEAEAEAEAEGLRSRSRSRSHSHGHRASLEEAEALWWRRKHCGTPRFSKHGGPIPVHLLVGRAEAAEEDEQGRDWSFLQDLSQAQVLFGTDSKSWSGIRSGARRSLLLHPQPFYRYTSKQKLSFFSRRTLELDLTVMFVY